MAAELDEPARASTALMTATLRRVTDAWARPPRVTWVRPELMHLTIRFLGEVEDELAPRVVEALRPPAAEPPVTAMLGACGVFPSRGAPRVVWRGVEHGAPALVRLKALVDARLEPLLGAGETRAFRPHLTIGRIRTPGSGIWSEALGATSGAVTQVAWRIEGLTLVRSVLGPEGPSYTPIVVIPLERRP